MLLDVLFQGQLCCLSLFLFQLLSLELKHLGLFVALRECQLPGLVLELHQFARVGSLLTGLSSESLVKLLDLQLMLLLQFLKT